MKSNIYKILLATVIILAGYACKKSFLETEPKGVFDEATLANEKGLNNLLLASYAMLDGHDGGLNLGGEWGSGGSNFNFGGIGGGEAHKGSDPGDQGPNMTNVLRHEYTPTNGALNDRWKALYEGVKRCNTVLQVLAKVTEISPAAAKDIEGQAKALRAWYHFQARITYGKVPYLDEIIDAQLANGEIEGVANDTEIFPQIIGDIKFAYENLPPTQDAVGRINKWVAGAIYGKVLLFSKDFATAKTVLTDVYNNGTNPLGVKFGLLANYDDNFNLSTENSRESVFAFQSSSLDNAGARNSNWGDLLNLPATGPGSAGFYCPTFFFTNKFKTDANGLPLANPQNTQILDPAGQPASFTKYSGNVDVRLDWTIGRNNVPYLDWGIYDNWSRDKSAGPFGAKKTCIRQSQVAATHDASVWFVGGGVALNMNIIRFSDVVLMLAEAEAEAGSLTTASTLLNSVRTRAKNSRIVSFPATEGTPKTEPYAAAFTTKTDALNAIRLERSLELGMEGWRFFDLVRWGTAEAELNAFYNYESQFPNLVLLIPKPVFDPVKNSYYAIPQQQIDLSKGFVKP